MLTDKRIAARDAEDALAALRLLPARGVSQKRTDSLFGSDAMRASAESFASLRRDHTRSMSSLPALKLPVRPSSMRALERPRPARPRSVRNPVTGEGMGTNEGGLQDDNCKPVYFTYKEVPFGAKSSAGRNSAWGDARGTTNPVEWPAEAGGDRFERPHSAVVLMARPHQAPAASGACAPSAAGGPHRDAPLTLEPGQSLDDTLALAKSLAASAATTRGTVSSRHASKRRSKLEYALWCEHARTEQAQRELHATLALVRTGVGRAAPLAAHSVSVERSSPSRLVPSFGQLNVSAMRGDAAKLTGAGLESASLAVLAGAAGGLGKLAQDQHARPQKSRAHKPPESSLDGIFYAPDDARRGRVYAYN